MNFQVLNGFGFGRKPSRLHAIPRTSHTTATKLVQAWDGTGMMQTPLEFINQTPAPSLILLSDQNHPVVAILSKVIIAVKSTVFHGARTALIL